MKSYKEFLEEKVLLYEKLITFGGKAFPNFGNIVIMAGGAGSGKGFIQGKLLGIQGRTFDVDELKKLASRTPGIVSRIKNEMGVDLEELGKNLRNPDNVSKLHGIIGDYLDLPDKTQKAFYASIMTAAPDRKPNIIFDVTLKDLRKLENITRQVSELGYKKENIHIVWVVNQIEVAKKQNSERSRVVPTEILVNTHRGASQTMHDIINMGNSLKRYMDGDIVFAFNQVGVDGELMKSGRNGEFLKDPNFFYVKKAGKAATPIDKLSKEIRMKISDYVPKNEVWY